MFEALSRTDPLADEAVEVLAGFGREQTSALLREAAAGKLEGCPAPVRELVAPLLEAPDWVDWDRIERAGVILRRAGILGGLVLALRSLVHGYAAPAGNKPLAMTGRLERDAGRRLSETARFVSAVGSPGGMRPGQAGFEITLKVRLMHAQVRRLLRSSDRWDQATWGLPINQHDMVSTILLFSTVFTAGLRALGVRVDPRERDDYVHLWRLVGWVIGVEPELLPHTDAEADATARLVFLTQGDPDDDARALTRALLQGPRRVHADHPARAEAHARVAEALCRHLVGDLMADQLGLDRTPWRAVVPAVQGVTRVFERARITFPAVHDWAVQAGDAHWKQAVSAGLEGVGASFGLPQTLAVST